MDTSRFTDGLRRRQTASRSELRAEFWKYFVFAFLMWGMASVILDHLIRHTRWAFIDIPAGLLTSLGAVFLSLVGWVRFKDLVEVKTQSK